LGQLLRDIARENNIAIVVANQVADRFEVFSAHYDTGNTMLPRPAQDSPLASRSTNAYRPPPSSGESVSGAAGQGTMLPPATPIFGQSEDATLTLDHQQRWITGWGDDYTPHPSLGSVPLAQKTPSLGLVWASQIACRIALIKTPVYGAGHEADQDNERGEVVLKKWRRYAKIVWAIWTRPSDPGVGGIGGAVEFEITRGGVKAVTDVDGEAEAQDMGGDMAS
jgi:DNA repair protein RAD57